MTGNHIDYLPYKIISVELKLLKLNRSRWLARQIIKYSINPTHLVYNSAHDCLEHCEWNLGTLGCHEIYSVYGTQCNCVIVGSLVAHNAD